MRYRHRGKPGFIGVAAHTGGMGRVGIPAWVTRPAVEVDDRGGSPTATRWTADSPNFGGGPVTEPDRTFSRFDEVGDGAGAELFGVVSVCFARRTHTDRHGQS
jgi:hypothetical protein